MKKLVKLGLVAVLGLSTVVTTASAIENGNYKCVVTQISVGKVYKKLAEKDYQIVNFNKSDEAINDDVDTFNYAYSEGKLDFYKNQKITIGVPGEDQGNKLFKFGYTLNKKDLTLIGWCKNKKYINSNKTQK